MSSLKKTAQKKTKNTTKLLYKNFIENIKNCPQVFIEKFHENDTFKYIKQSREKIL